MTVSVFFIYYVGVNAVDGLEESVVRPFIISEDLGNVSTPFT